MSTSTTGSQGPGPQAPIAMRSDVRAAVYGLLGAIIGGLATFAGAYWSGHQTLSLAQSTTARAACVAFASVADQYLNNLRQLQDSLNEGSNSYARARTTIIAGLPSLYADSVQVDLSNDRTVSQDAADLASTVLTISFPIDGRQMDPHALAKAALTVANQLTKFQLDAGTELNPLLQR
jgi:hypothetical protein